VKTPRADMPQFYLRTFHGSEESDFSTSWHVDGQYDKLEKVGERRQRHDFLLVHASSYGGGLKLELLLLYWEGGSAFRGGTVMVSVSLLQLKEFWRESRPRFLRFSLG
jgi:hypothetical protein